MNYINPFLTYLNTIGYHYRTIQSKETHLKHYKYWLTTENKDILKITTKTIQKYYQDLQKQKSHCSIRSINNYLISLKQFYSWTCKSQYLKKHPFGKFKTKKEPKYNTRKPIDLKTIKKLYKTSKYPIEKLLLLLAYGCGLRTFELQHLKVKDINIEKALLTVVSGKFNKQRSIPLQYEHLNYLKNYSIHKNLKQEDYIFQTPTGMISQSILRSTFKNMQHRIGLPQGHFTIHHLRHSIASHLVDRGVTIQLVQYFLGHSTLTTTQKYVHLNKTINYGTIKKMGN